MWHSGTLEPIVAKLMLPYTVMRFACTWRHPNCKTVQCCRVICAKPDRVLQEHCNSVTWGLSFWTICDKGDEGLCMRLRSLSLSGHQSERYRGPANRRALHSKSYFLSLVRKVIVGVGAIVTKLATASNAFSVFLDGAVRVVCCSIIVLHFHVHVSKCQLLICLFSVVRSTKECRSFTLRPHFRGHSKTVSVKIMQLYFS